MYWSMLETGLGFVAANLIVVYGLLAHSNLVPYLRSLNRSNAVLQVLSGGREPTG